jgi:hypothetical protein
MLSGEAKPMVIFEKVALGRFSFLIAILQYAVFVSSNPLHIKKLTHPAYARKVKIELFVCFRDQIKEGKGTNLPPNKYNFSGLAALPADPEPPIARYGYNIFIFNILRRPIGGLQQ